MSLTVLNVIERLFPNLRTMWLSENGSQDGWPHAPDFPPDLFAAASYLLEIAGAYQYAAPGEPSETWPTADRYMITKAEAGDLLLAGQEWSASPETPALVTRLWGQLGTERDKSIFEEHGKNWNVPDWWKAATQLMIIADEACADVGYGTTRQFSGGQDMSQDPSWISEIALMGYDEIFADLVDKELADNSPHVKMTPTEASLCLMVDRDVACVQPKSRTPNVGCTLRTLSHNLALLPPRGVVRATWQRPPWPVINDDYAALNLLLVPFPYFVPAVAFKAEYQVRPDAENASAAWGWFDIDQTWLSEIEGNEETQKVDALAEFVIQLARKAKQDVSAIHGILFPEYSLNWDFYQHLIDKIRMELPEIEFVVAGSSENCRGDHGNMALSTVFEGDSSDGSTGRVAISTSRPKHHRWRLDGSQIAAYALASALDPRAKWWEKIALQKREIHVNVFRSGSTFVTMICEDLARSDPCHVVLRSIAPSLVFALLMDGPQLADRWASRYATALADDPGSSVLTFTSLGLLERANRTKKFPECRQVALWKDDTGHTVPISLDRGAQGIVLTLSGHKTSETTIDGRTNHDGRAWRYHGHQPVALMAELIPLTTA